MRDPELVRRATTLWQEAYAHQMQGDLERAVELYQRSIDVCPTAEAHTFLGWTMSFQGRLEEATRECLKAIEVDPDFGNPYNDIGCYLMQQGKLEEAIPWLEKAKRADLSAAGALVGGAARVRGRGTAGACRPPAPGDPPLVSCPAQLTERQPAHSRFLPIIRTAASWLSCCMIAPR